MIFASKCVENCVHCNESKNPNSDTPLKEPHLVVLGHIYMDNLLAHTFSTPTVLNYRTTSAVPRKRLFPCKKDHF